MIKNNDTGPAADDGLRDVDPYADGRCGFAPTAALEACTLGDEDDGGGWREPW